MALIKNFMRRLALRLAPFAYTALTSLLFLSCRVKEGGLEHRRTVEEGGHPFIAAFWHYSIFYIVHRARGRKWVAMVSASKDGEFIAGVLKRMGFQTVRGSSGRGGVAALRSLIAAMAAQKINAAIVADGSRGPARKAQAGAILLAAKSGAPILPVAWAADRYLAFGSWDRTVLPLPFARISLHYGEPLVVPAQPTTTEIEDWRQRLEEQLNTLYQQAWREFGREGH